ncbi:hypothetical protein QZH41_001272 [Actinostola sp. cb2023]|nr:hypothetical protein QZH41_001272 [Actinostola sp. cb2023]
MKYYENSLSINIEVGNKEMEGMAHFKIGNVYRKMGSHGEAIRHLKNSLDIAIQSGNRTAEGRAYCNLGDASYALGDSNKAIEYHEKHLNIVKITGDETEEAIAYRNLGCAYSSLAKYDQAIEYHEKSLSIATELGDRQGERCAYGNLGVAFEALAKFPEAIKYHDKSLNIAIEMKNRKAEGLCYGNLGNVYRQIGKYHKAIEYLKKDLDIAIEIGDRKGQGSACGNLGIACNLIGKYEEAIEYCLRHSKIAQDQCDRRGEMKAYGNLGSTYLSLGKVKEAIHYHNKYLNIARDIDDRHAEARAYNNLGSAYISLGQYIQAIEYHKKTLDAATKISDRKLEGTAYGNLAMAFLNLGKCIDAKKCSTKYLNITKEIGDRNAEGNANQILGDICFMLGKEHEATEHYKMALNIAMETGNRSQEGMANGSLGNCYGILGYYKEAIKYHEKDLEISVEIGDRDGEGKSCGNLGNAYAFIGKYNNAIKYYERSLQVAKEIGDKKGEGIACSSLGHCYYLLSCYHKENGDQPNALLTMKESERCFKDSLDCNEWLFDHLGDQDQFKISIVDTYILAYQLLTSVYIETGQTEQALLVSERKRARALEDILTGKYNLERKSDRRDQHFLEYSDVTSKVLSPNSCVLFYSELLRPVGISEYESGVGMWVLDSKNPVCFQRKKMEELKVMLEDPENQSSKNILHKLVDKSYLTLSVRGAMNCENRSMDILHEGAFGNEGDAASSRTDPKRNLRCIYNEELAEDYLEVLFNVLITPVQHELTYDEMAIIPDGPLFKVPFAALRDPITKSFLSETKRIRFVPSLTTLRILKESSVESHSMTGALIVGDPDVTGERMYKGKKTHFNPLPNAKLEAERIGEVLGVTAITGAQATKQAIKQRLREGVAVIHFATHGCADSGEIVLSPGTTLQEAGTIPEEDDYLLTINEVQEIGLRARLVVLSCCHSGRGEIKSEGVVGMSRAFLAAGALAVVASLWAVDDQATRVFMEKFYAHLKEGKSASRSLQQAMKEMRDTTCYDKPMYWAPFILIGDDVTIKP